MQGNFHNSRSTNDLQKLIFRIQCIAFQAFETHTDLDVDHRDIRVNPQIEGKMHLQLYSPIPER